MNKSLNGNCLFDLHLEYSAEAERWEKECRELEGRFARVFGYHPFHLDDVTFDSLTDAQKDACTGFWENRRVVETRNKMLSARTLAAAYFDAFADSK